MFDKVKNNTEVKKVSIKGEPDYLLTPKITGSNKLESLRKSLVERVVKGDRKIGSIK